MCLSPLYPLCQAEFGQWLTPLPTIYVTHHYISHHILVTALPSDSVTKLLSILVPLAWPYLHKLSPILSSMNTSSALSLSC
jgi:hypothetical protein